MITAGLRRKPDESRLDLINRNVELFLNILGQVKAAGLKREAIVLVVSNPVDVLTYLAATPARPAAAPGHRPGNAARHGPVPQPDRRGTQAPAHPGHGPDPGRARRQHGADLVGRAGRRAAAGEVSRLDQRRGRGALHAHQGQRRRGDQAQGRRGVRRRPLDPRGGPRRRPRHEANPAGVVPGAAARTASATSASRCRRSSAGKGSRPSSRSSSGPRKSRPCSTRPRCSARRSTQVQKSNPKAAGKPSRGVRPRSRPAKTAASPPSRPRDHGSGGGNGNRVHRGRASPSRVWARARTWRSLR